MDQHGLNISEDVQFANDAKAVVLIPVMVYVGVLMIAGTIGNALVCYVYYFKFKKTPSNYFVVWLAMLDLLTCILGMPFEIVDLRYPYMFHFPYLCKAMRFTESLTTISSGFTLIAVAFDRYFKICKPLKRFPNIGAKMMNCASFAAGLVLALPAIFVFGMKEIHIPHTNHTGFECSVDDDISNSIYPMLYFAIQAGVYVLCVFSLGILYALLWRTIHRRKNKVIGATLPLQTQDSMTVRTEKECLYINDKKCITFERASDSSNEVEVDKRHPLKYLPRQSSSKSTKSVRSRTGSSTIRTGRTTKILLSVSVAFIISFVPYLVVKILKYTMREQFSHLSTAAEIAYNFATRSYCINNAINPIIYSFLNNTFRSQCASALKSLFLIRFCQREQNDVFRRDSNCNGKKI